MTSLRLSALMSTPTTFEPPAAHFSEISWPKPLPPPVTMMTLSFSYCDMPTLPIQSEKLCGVLDPPIQAVRVPIDDPIELARLDVLK